MSTRYVVIREGTDGLGNNYGGSYLYLKDAVLNAEWLTIQGEESWIVIRKKDGKVVWRPGDGTGGGKEV